MSKEMKKFLEENHLSRSIEILNHCNGFRVSLYDKNRDISSGVSDSVENAFLNALEYFKDNLKAKNEREQKEIRDRIAEEENKIQKLRDLLKSK